MPINVYKNLDFSIDKPRETNSVINMIESSGIGLSSSQLNNSRNENVNIDKKERKSSTLK